MSLWFLHLGEIYLMRRVVIITSILLLCIASAILFTNFKKSEPLQSTPEKQLAVIRACQSSAVAQTDKRQLATDPLLPDSLASIDTLLVAHKGQYRMHLYAKGKLLKTYVIGLGQAPLGHKQQQGDNRTPEGTYKIIQKSRGPFEGEYAHYLGVAWMRLNYPNNADAIAGFSKGLITEKQKNAIIAANNAGKEPLKTTKLGGGIGIHGWYGEWPGDDKQNLTWGCISVQNTELEDLYKRVPLGTTVVILP